MQRGIYFIFEGDFYVTAAEELSWERTVWLWRYFHAEKRLSSFNG